MQIKSFDELKINDEYYYVYEDSNDVAIVKYEFLGKDSSEDEEHGLFIDRYYSNYVNKYDCLSVDVEDFNLLFFDNKEECEKELSKELTNRLKEYRKYRKFINYSDITTVEYEDIRVGDKLFLVCNLSFYEVEIVYKKNDKLVFVEVNDDNSDELLNFNLSERFFYKKEHAGAKVLENIYEKFLQLDCELKYFDFEENDIVYYVEDYKLRKTILKKGETFNKNSKGFLCETHAKEYLIELHEDYLKELKKELK